MSDARQPPPLQTSPPSTTGFFTGSNINSPLTPDYDDVESPSLTSGNALARFEFEKPGARESRNGTKVLMVEWEDDHQTQDVGGDWTVGWEGKKAAVLSAYGADGPREGGSREGLHRLYFLLSAGERVPGTISLTLRSPDGEEKAVWRTHPLPAIFPPELGASAREAGKKGVLHTVWAKKRLQVLRHEIQHEECNNPEGVALSMAMQERDWIESNFGVLTKPHGIDITSVNKPDNLNHGLPSPTSPRSPGRGPLLEKLKGLRVDTQADQTLTEQNPLSPEGSDMAVNFTTFAALNGLPDPASLAAKPAQHTYEQPTRMTPQLPPHSILAQQKQVGMASLNAFANDSNPVQFRTLSDPQSTTINDAQADEDDLFALPLSPRSPDQGKGAAFSFTQADTAQYTQ